MNRYVMEGWERWKNGAVCQWWGERIRGTGVKMATVGYVAA